MDGLAATELNTVVAPLNFLIPMAEKPVAYNYCLLYTSDAADE